MEEGGFRQRFLDRVCERRGALTSAFVLSGLVFVASMALLALVDLAWASQVIAVVDAGVSGMVLVGSGAMLRACNRFQHRSSGTRDRRD